MTVSRPSPEAYARIAARLRERIPAPRVIDDPVRRLALSADASCYRLIPEIVVRADTEDEVALALSACAREGAPLTFRAAGTSLCGQAISNSVLVLAGEAWNRCAISPDAATITLQPGIRGCEANRRLAPFHRKIGPDPASINACMIGGIAANNASGMCCGTAQNSYRTLESLRVLFADGTRLDTGNAEERRAFAARRSELLAGLSDLAARVRAETALADRIRAKYRMKNTTGYSLNALVDFDDPIEILQHLLIGSEGTLGFLSEITYRTVPHPPSSASALLFFRDIADACAAVVRLKAGPVAAVEIMDRAALRSVERKPDLPESLSDLGPEAAALLIETRAGDPDALRRQIAVIQTAVAEAGLLRPPRFVEDPDAALRLWNIRKGLFPSVGSMRRPGTTVIIEDVAFPLPRLAAATLDLQGLFRKFDYGDAIIFGHALEGNLHFVFSQDFGSPAEVRRYGEFIRAVAELVVHRYDGSLKAEHGTGRNMAPFVELEWGPRALDWMREIKRLFDPDRLLNPGVLLNDDPEIHLRNLKPMPAADPLVDQCIECGFCEPRCPSRNLTWTPRQRIVVRREIARREAVGERVGERSKWRRVFAYQGDRTCATDGLCAMACPVDIDTGALIKRWRSAANSPGARAVAGAVARHFGIVAAGARLGLGAADLARRLLGPARMERWAARARRWSGNRLPAWNVWMPRAAPRPRRGAVRDPAAPAVVYFPSCLNRTFGAVPGEPADRAGMPTTLRLCDRAGFRVIYPARLSRLCCGLPFSSKGFTEAGDAKIAELEAELRRASENGRWPILVDMTPCLYRMREKFGAGLKLYDPASFALEFLLPRLPSPKPVGAVAIHHTCSAIKLGIEPALREVARRCAARVIEPTGIECCGWAGDRGFSTPELTASALSRLAEQLPEDCAAGYSTSRTCEIGLALHSNRPYRPILALVEQATLQVNASQARAPRAGS